MVFVKMVILVTIVKVFFLLSLFVDRWKLGMVDVDSAELVPELWNLYLWLLYIIIFLTLCVNKHFGNCGYVFVQSPSAAQVEVSLALRRNPKHRPLPEQPRWPLHQPLAPYKPPWLPVPMLGSRTSPQLRCDILVANVGLEVDLLEWGALQWRLVDICWNGEFLWWSMQTWTWCLVNFDCELV